MARKLKDGEAHAIWFGIIAVGGLIFLLYANFLFTLAVIIGVTVVLGAPTAIEWLWNKFIASKE